MALIPKGSNKPPVQNYASRRIQENLAALCRPYVQECVTYYVEVLRDPEQPTKERLYAADRLLDRGFGKPVDMVVLAGMDTNGTTTTPELLTTAQLLALLTPVAVQHQDLDLIGDTVIADANLPQESTIPPASV